MLTYLGLAILFIVLWIFYSSVYKPYRKYKEYLIAFRKHNYKVLDLGFIPFFTSYFFHLIKGKKQHKDAQYFPKHEYSKNDVVIGNLGSQPMIFVINE